MKQTAVEWLVEKLDQNFDYVADTLINQAKEMEKEQMMDAIVWARDPYGAQMSPSELSLKKAEQYYNETFKSE